MLLREYFQKKHSMSRRNFTKAINDEEMILDWNIVHSYKQEIFWNEKLFWNWQKETIILPKNEDTKIVLFNKPVDYVVSKSDPHNKTIFSILPEWFVSKYYPIGRLDKNSRGLLLLTNDPKLVDKFEHPRYGVQKEYIVQLDQKFKESDLNKMLKWVESDWEKLKCKNVEIIEYVENKKKEWNENTHVKILLTEWKKRHIRRMLKSLDYEVLDLVRVREGQYTLGNIAEWKWKVMDYVA